MTNGTETKQVLILIKTRKVMLNTEQEEIHLKGGKWKILP